MALQHLVIGGFPNPVLADPTRITPSAVGSTMTGDNLKTIEPTEVLRITSVFPHGSHVLISFNSFDTSVTTDVQLLAHVADSLIPGDQLRVIGYNGDLSTIPVRSQTLPPTLIESSSNITGVVGNVDEHPSAADSSFIQPANVEIPWNVRLSFGTPSFAPAVGSGDLATTPYQCFVVWARIQDIQVGAVTYPVITAKLYEGGVLKANLGSKAVTSETGQLLIFPWDASVLSNSNGSGVEVRIEGTPGPADTPDPASYIQLDSVAWECLYQSDADSVDFDTGWITRQGQETESVWGDTSPVQSEQLDRSWSTLLPSPVTVKSIRVEYRVDGVGFHTNFLSTTPRTPATYIDIGVVIASTIFDAPYRFSPGGTIQWQHFPVGGDSISGANRQVSQWIRRVANIILEVLPNSTAHRVFARLDRKGPNHPIFVMLDPSTTDEVAKSNTSFYAVVTEAQGLTFLGDGIVSGERIKSLGYTFTERL